MGKRAPWVNKERASAAGIAPATVHTRRRRGQPEADWYKPSAVALSSKDNCPCGCGEPGVLPIGARLYCATTAAILRGTEDK